jgi:hypothetical protein
MTAPANPYPTLAQKIDPTILHSIQRASQATSTDFGLLMAQAAQESGFHADAKSTTSSAQGLYQFVESTWLDMVHRFGAKYGAGQLAQQIGQDGNGKVVVSDPAVRKQILDLRQDPAISAALAGEYTKLNQAEVERALGHPLQRADLYMAHFLGATGASAFLKAVETRGNVAAADLLPEAASANKGIFFDAQTGQARSVADIYHSLASKIEKAASDLAGLASPGIQAPPSIANEASSPSAPPSAGAVSSLGRKLDWSGVKLSGAILDMLNIVALAALKLTGTERTAIDTPPAATQTRERRSI